MEGDGDATVSVEVSADVFVAAADRLLCPALGEPAPRFTTLNGTDTVGAGSRTSRSGQIWVAAGRAGSDGQDSDSGHRTDSASPFQPMGRWT